MKEIIEFPVTPITEETSYYGDYSMAISGNTAFVGYPDADDNEYTGVVRIYEKDENGVWSKVSEVSGTPNSYFGTAVEVYGDFACVSDLFSFTLFRRRKNGKMWTSFQNITVGWEDGNEAGLCAISGDTFAMSILGWDESFIHLYKFNEDSDEVVEIQDPISAMYGLSSLTLSDDYLFYWDGEWYEEEVYIYKWVGWIQAFNFQQLLNFSQPDFRGIGHNPLGNKILAHDADMLVVGGQENVHIYSEQGGRWTESVTLGGTYDLYELSGRDLVVINGTEIHSFNVENCVQATPTQAPSKSLAPTACYVINIAIVYDDNPWHTSWELRKSESFGFVLELYEETNPNATYHERSLCLPEGEYTFAIQDSYLDGICCWDGNGRYNLTSDGNLIVEGGDFGYADETEFSLPFVPAQ